MRPSWCGALARVGLVSLALAAYLESVRLAFAAAFSPMGLAGRWLFVVALLAVAYWLLPVPVAHGRSLWPRWLWPVLAIGALAGGLCAHHAWTWAAWLAVAAFQLALLAVAAAWDDSRFLGRWLMPLPLAVCAGALPVAAAQLESHFAEEEFFVALQAVVLALFWLLMLMGVRLLGRRARPPAGVLVHRNAPTAALLAVGLAAILLVGRGYQRSFYPDSAPGYAGVSLGQPFLCGEAEPETSAPSGEDVFEALLQQVEANPKAGAPEFGMLALARGERRWAERFREALLAEAGVGKYTEPAQSVKIGQYEAALRVYYYARVGESFPGLFGDRDDAAVRAWFAEVNRRAMTVEWVDWMYGLAFAMRPEGPYENQENGAGLVALLRATGLEAPELGAANADYLERNQRGWLQRFRNTDDAISYQPAWINNAYFQTLAGADVDEANMALSFEWLLLQSLPDGACLTYDHPLCYTLAKTAYLGATLLDDGRLVWMADRALDAAIEQGSAVGAQPGVEEPVVLAGESPAVGSCLIYGNSGLPNQAGPLAPDKIVLRDGWEADSRYLLLNLRFTGWHRYKATNTITLMYQGGAVAADALTGADFGWLPAGRALFRDKRIPRENLNGLQVPRTGMSAVVHGLTGIGGEWAQDPPYYAMVERFESLGVLDVSQTAVDDWRGWRHERSVYFLHGGPALIVDEAQGPGAAAVTWHVLGDGSRVGDAIVAGESGSSRLLWPAGAWDDITIAASEGARAGQPGVGVTYEPSGSGSLSLATVWLSDAWATGPATVVPVGAGDDGDPGAYLLTAGSSDGSLRLLVNVGDGAVNTGGITSDGDAVAVLIAGGSATVCAVGGTDIAVGLDQAVTEVVQDGMPLAEGADWEWQDGRLLLHNGGVSRCVDLR